MLPYLNSGLMDHLLPEVFLLLFEECGRDVAFWIEARTRGSGLSLVEGSLLIFKWLLQLAYQGRSLSLFEAVGII